MLRVGEVFAGYVIERQIGRGGMGELYLARHPRLPRLIAVKVLRPDFAADREIRARFEREADLIARLDHPNVVSVYDRGVEDGQLWIAMQYVDGVDASTLDPATLPPERAVHIIGETAKALDYAHAVGVLHRDVKPANIMLARPSPGHGERVLLTDFGIGRLRDDTRNLTRTGTLTATMAYASPEQLSGARPDHRSDQYSLACTLFWLLCGSTPFEADDVAAVVAGHLHFPPPRVSSRRPGLPSALDAVLVRALAKKPDDRFASCAEFAAAALRGVQDTTDTAPSTAVVSGPIGATTFVNADPPQRGSAVPGVPPYPATAPPSNPTGAPETPPPIPARATGTRPPVRRRVGQWVTVGALGLVVILVVAAGIIWATWDSGSDKASSASGGSARPADDHVALFAGIQPAALLDQQGGQITPPTPALDPAGYGGATCAPVSIAMTGPLSGDNAPLGENVLGGVRLAVARFTARNPECRVTVKEFDSQSDPRIATQVAPRIVNDTSVVALIGPVFSGETRATGQTYSDAGLPFLTPSAVNSILSTLGWRTFFRGLADDNLEGPVIARHLAASFGRVCVLRDDSDYGNALARGVTAGLGAAAVPECAFAIKSGEDPAAAVNRVVASAPDAVFYAGYYSEAAPLVQRLRQAGSSATFVSADGSFDPEFVTRAYGSASGALLFCPCAPPTDHFLDDYRSANGGAAGAYSVEAYDLTAIVLQGIASGHVTRADLVSYLRGYSGIGMAHDYQWTSAGDLTEPRIWLYRVG